MYVSQLNNVISLMDNVTWVRKVLIETKFATITLIKKKVIVDIVKKSITKTKLRAKLAKSLSMLRVFTKTIVNSKRVEIYRNH